MEQMKQGRLFMSSQNWHPGLRL